MVLSVRYDDEFEEIELSDKDAERLWISLSLEDMELSQEERERRIQQQFDIKFNRPEYNSFHAFERHRGYSVVTWDEEEGEELVNPEPLLSEVRDKSVFWKYEEQNLNEKQYMEVCERVRNILAKKPRWAEAFISVRLDGWSVNDYADKLGLKDASIVSHWLKRAERKLKEKYPVPSDFLRVYGYSTETNKKRGTADD